MVRLPCKPGACRNGIASVSDSALLRRAMLATLSTILCQRVTSMDLNETASASPTRDTYLVSRPYAWLVFGLTFLLVVIDFIDRQIVVSMFPALKLEWQLSDKELGSLISIISVIVAVGSIPIALLADRWSRTKSIALMALVWSLATIACGFAASYAQLLTARGFIGIGEAGYGAVGGALLASLFPSRLRATIISAFIAGATIGGVLGVVLGGVISAKWGWRSAFGIVGVPGFVLALMYFFVRDYKTVALVTTNAVGAAVKIPVSEMAATLFRTPAAVSAYIGGGLQLLLVSTLYAWLPSFLNRSYGLPMDQAGIKAAIVLLMGSIGAVFWGFVADRVSRKRPRNKMLVMAFCALATFIIHTVAFGYLEPGDRQFQLIVFGGLFMTGMLGTCGAVVIDVVHPGLRATAAAINALAQNLIGLASGPIIAGALSDVYGLPTALTLMPVFCLLSAIVFALGSRSYERDLSRAGGTSVNVGDNGSSVVTPA